MHRGEKVQSEEIVHMWKPNRRPAPARCFIPNANFDAGKVPFPILEISNNILFFSSQFDYAR